MKSRSEWQSEINEACFMAYKAGNEYQRFVDEANMALAQEAQLQVWGTQQAFESAENQVNQVRFRLDNLYSSARSELSRIERIVVPNGPARLASQFSEKRQKREEEISMFRSFVTELEQAIFFLESIISKTGRPGLSATRMGTASSLCARGGFAGFPLLPGIGCFDGLSPTILSGTACLNSSQPLLKSPPFSSLSMTSVFPMLGTISHRGTFPDFSTHPQYIARLYSSDRVVLSPTGASLVGLNTVPSLSIRLSSPVSSFGDTLFSPGPYLSSSCSFGGSLGSAGSFGGSLGGLGGFAGGLSSGF